MPFCATARASLTLLASSVWSAAIAFAKVQEKEYFNLDNEIETIANKIEIALEKINSIKDIAKEIYNVRDAFFLGRGFDFPVAQEGSLKLKEISYIHSEAYAAGELKHGTISLVKEGYFIFSTYF